MAYCQEQTSAKFESKYKIFITENVFENVDCEMAAIFFGPGRDNLKNAWSFLIPSGPVVASVSIFVKFATAQAARFSLRHST